jgi:tetratricopeptide (TPR) repeat protein
VSFQRSFENRYSACGIALLAQRCSTPAGARGAGVPGVQQSRPENKKNNGPLHLRHYTVMPAVAILVCLLFFGESAFDRGISFYKERNYGAAINALEEALETELTQDQRGEALLLLGQSYYSLQRFAQAIGPLEKRQQISDRLEVRYMLGTAYVQTRQSEKSRAAFASMFGLETGSPGARLVNAQMMVRNGFESDAEQELRPALEANQSIPGLHLLAGELAMYRGDLQGAIRHLRGELEVSPGSAMAFYKLGDAFTRSGKWEAAIPNLQRSIWLNPYYSGPYILLGKAYLNTKSLANAEGMLRRAIELDPQNRSAHYLLGQTLMQSGKDEEGRRFLQRFRELGP